MYIHTYNILKLSEFKKRKNLKIILKNTYKQFHIWKKYVRLLFYNT